MKAQIYNYAGIIILYILYNQFFRVQDEKQIPLSTSFLRVFCLDIWHIWR
jgi:hypothetical protein